VQTAGPGTDNGIWTFTVDSNGNATGCGTSKAGNFTLAGTASSSGDVEIASGTTSNGASFSGTVGLDGTVSGTWTNSAAGTSGTYTGSRTTGPVISCPGSSQPAEPTPVPAPVASYGSLAISGVDTSSIGTSFNAGSGELNVNFTTTTVNTYSWYDEVTSALTDGASLEVVFVPGTMTTINYVFSTLSGTSVFYAYSLTKLSNDVVIVNEA
jgi:hypothetical protein